MNWGKRNDCDKVKLDWWFMIKIQNNNDHKLKGTIKYKIKGN